MGALRNAVTIAVVAVLCAGCGGSGLDPGDQVLETPPVKGATQVTTKNLKFTPPVIEITPGTTVTWKFDDGSVPHNVKAAGGEFISPTSENGTFTHEFTKAGTFDYKCDLHPGMNGRVIVSDNG